MSAPTTGATSPQTEKPGPGIVKVVFASLIGTAVEWYDFFLYGSAAALVFGTLFFPDADPVNATLLAFGTYAVGFCVSNTTTPIIGDRVTGWFQAVPSTSVMPG